MHPLLLIAVTLWTSSAFFPGALDRQLAASARRHLPVEFALQEAGHLHVTFHRDASGAPAAYLQADATGPARLALYGPYYLNGLALRPVDDMPVDVCESYFYALLDAYLRRQVGLPRSWLGHELQRRAELTMVDVPRAHRVEAYLDAQASFGAHLLAVANELDRIDRRRHERGRSLCRVLDRPLPLVELWESILGAAPYFGAYFEGSPLGDEAVHWSRSTLTAADKRFLLDSVLHTHWSDRSARSDLEARYCSG